jgi:hypothetical protein
MTAQAGSGAPRPSFGAYALANDALLDVFTKMAESFRHHNPDMPMTVIPFDDNMDQTRVVCDRLGLDIIDYDYDQYDAIGRNWRATRHGTGIFRKYFVFDGPYDQFMFIDADCTILNDLSPFIPVLDDNDLDLAYYARPGQNRNLRAPEIKALGKLVGNSPEGINDAFFLARKGLLHRDFLFNLSKNAARIKRDLLGPANQQALFSYSCVISGMRFRCLVEVAEPLTPPWSWDRPLVRRANGFYYHTMAIPRPIRVMHWGLQNFGKGPNAWIVDDYALDAASQTASAAVDAEMERKD